jgi:hypothetical protein
MIDRVGKLINAADCTSSVDISDGGETGAMCTLTAVRGNDV